ncbi:MAG: class I SAM-dependent DNA methyltransferase [Prevotella sp.]|nr:class I SAM-dependent DNA methyltransferase [Prevotella sp.]
MQQQNSVCDFSSSDSWVILSPIEQSIKRKIEAVGTPLKDWDIQINYGIKTGFNDAFIISTEKRNEILANCKDANERQRTDELIRPILRGRDIKRYGYDWANLYLIATFPARRYDIEKYPAVKDYLLSFGMERLEQTGKTHKVNGESVKARKKTNNKWYETQDSISYWEDFSKPRIVYREIGEAMDACMIPPNVMINNKLYMISGKHLEHLIRFFNSNLFNKIIFTKANLTGGKGIDFMENIRVPLPLECDLSMCEELYVDNLLYTFYGLTQIEVELIESV